MKTQILGLKELRENMDKYVSLIKKGRSFIVVKKSKPVFKLVSPESEDQWEPVADFTTINKKGIPAEKILQALRQMNAHS